MIFTTPQQVCDDANIRAVLNRYSRAIDRCDMELLKTVYWPDAIDDHAIFVGNPVQFAEFVTPILRDRTKATMHTLSNTTIELEGDVALTETYVRAYHHMVNNSKKVDVILGGRYLDRFERRNEEWRIAERTFVLDWDVEGAVLLGEEAINRLLAIDHRHKGEDSYRLFLNKRLIAAAK